MRSGDEAITRAYLQHLSPRDLALLAGAPSPTPDLATGLDTDLAADLARSPEALDGRLNDPSVFDTLFARPGEGEPLLGASPFLAFAVAVHRCALELASMTYVSEWLGPGRHAPVFDVAELRSFLDVPWNRFFLAELLHSYTHVASGSVFVRMLPGAAPAALLRAGPGAPGRPVGGGLRRRAPGHPASPGRPGAVLDRRVPRLRRPAGVRPDRGGPPAAREEWPTTTGGTGRRGRPWWRRQVLAGRSACSSSWARVGTGPPSSSCRNPCPGTSR